jgi:PAS domain S-box-containing protein
MLHDNSKENYEIRAILEGTSGKTGAEFFFALVKNLSDVLNTSGAWVTELFQEERILRAHAFCYKNRWIKDFRYRIDGTPCENVIDKKRFVHIKENVSNLFPDSPDFGIKVVSYMGAPLLDVNGDTLGLLAVIDEKPMPEEKGNEAIFHIFAGRAAAELQRLRAEKEIREKEGKLRSLINSAMDGIIELDENLSITMLNPAAVRLVNCSPEEAVGKRFPDLLSEKSRKIFNGSLQELKDPENGEKYIWITDSLTIHCKNGIKFPAEATLSQNELNNETFFTVILRNINDKLEAEKKIDALKAETEYLKEELKLLSDFDEIIGQSRPVMNLLKDIDLIAKTDSTVLISGETGSGKELVARAIHSAGKRKDRQLIKVNCAAIPSTLIESEFFGHVSGAFTGATRKRMGRFELADGGTIFLDEIGDLHLDLQAKLLRVLQDGEFEPVGSSETKKINVRVIAATNRDLKDEIKKGKFREDLYYRLNVYPIFVPPLRERGDDIIRLATEFINRFSREQGIKPPKLTADIQEKLLSYNWPGNVRELQNVIERAVITSRDDVLNMEGIIPDENNSSYNSAAEYSFNKILSQKELQEFEKANIIRALKTTNWKISGNDGAANLLGLPSTTLSSKIKALGLKKEISGD